MGFRGKKIYGESQLRRCPFCSNQATIKNPQGIEVCTRHTSTKLQEIRCPCGLVLEPRSGKFGSYFHCDRCGNISARKGMELMTTPTTSESPRVPKEITITSRDVDYD
ncbi:hypothetical protein HY488_03470 [Candidatus Woesearchaeota archaeon]|nr:hypothetical protein [Candidatus Woesearchaeota archaeon]